MINRYMSTAISTIPLYLAKSGVKTPISSPPFETVIAVTETIEEYPFWVICCSFSDSLYSKSRLTPITIGIIPIKPRINEGTAKASKAARDDITTSIIIPKNCPAITLCANSPGIANSKIKINVSSIFDAINAPIPVPKRPIKSVK